MPPGGVPGIDVDVPVFERGGYVNELESVSQWCVFSIYPHCIYLFSVCISTRAVKLSRLLEF